ncbi:ATP-binding cassette domain-containing protein [Iocasia frigidifontis]|uniref:ATP-binding cassette domain-containing protein n=1 Tax=Iocasia fonsfrigidae TaxID=2682810 RepID=A0A8A7K9J9_9FIRM|nr:ATP-binding cassette domain-containing protein [Iocasia fonsfrigidae]QTL96765.1 ATP-binding cassette domain-containing protein [Iocasia fonsfrigidae]
MLKLNNLHKVFNYGRVNQNYALRGVDITIPRGDFLTVIGSNGAGKSTLLNLVAGTYFPEIGQIEINEQTITDWPVSKRAFLVGRVFQDPLMGTAAEMTIEENLSMAALRGKRRGLRPGLDKTRRQEFRELLSLLGLGLEERLEYPVKLLSGGQRQALTLLMATLGDPEVLLLDEHTAALDPSTAIQIMEITEKIVEKKNLTVLMVTHDLKQALDMGNRTIMMDKGQIILDIKDEERAETTVAGLLKKFSELRGHELTDDRVLLSD